jgi:hypothetical protein
MSAAMAVVMAVMTCAATHPAASVLNQLMTTIPLLMPLAKVGLHWPASGAQDFQAAMLTERG